MYFRTIISMIIIVVVIFGLLTAYKLDKEFPKGESCCKDIKNPTSNSCYTCDDYSLINRIIYVWKY